MGELDQCIEILGLASYEWRERRIAMVEHSFRVMSKARNYDELVVGLMHHGYAYCNYTSSLFKCDVDYKFEWRESLDLLVDETRKSKLQSQDIEEWTGENCKWTRKYEKRLERIGFNRLARNVLIYDLEDTLEMFKIEEKSGKEVDMSTSPLIYPLSDEVKSHLINKYSRALALLKRYRERDRPHIDDFTEEEYDITSKSCIKWYNEWLAFEMESKRYFEMNYEEEGNL